MTAIQSCFPAAATLHVDLTAIQHNWNLLRSQADGYADCAAVVKADAYGLGAIPVSQALYQAGCRNFFVALLDEALQLRPLLPDDARLFVLNGVFPNAESECAANGLIPVLNSIDQVQRWSELARSNNAALPAAIQVDTGMARLGLSTDDLTRLQTDDWLGIRPVLLMSHLVSAEDSSDPINAAQLQRFRALRANWPSVPCSLANSSGVFLGADWHFDLLRPGAALYGVAPMLRQTNPMKTVVRLKGRMIQHRLVQDGVGVGYNHMWRANGQRRVATVSVGYADGWLRSLSNRASLNIKGHAVPLVGRVSMDTITVDVTEVPEDQLQPGIEFDLIDDEHDINAVALEAGTSAYEILTSLGQRYRREYTTI